MWRAPPPPPLTLLKGGGSPPLTQRLTFVVITPEKQELSVLGGGLPYLYIGGVFAFLPALCGSSNEPWPMLFGFAAASAAGCLDPGSSRQFCCDEIACARLREQRSYDNFRLAWKRARSCRKADSRSSSGRESFQGKAKPNRISASHILEVLSGCQEGPVHASCRVSFMAHCHSWCHLQQKPQSSANRPLNLWSLSHTPCWPQSQFVALG